MQLLRCRNFDCRTYKSNKDQLTPHIITQDPSHLGLWHRICCECGMTVDLVLAPQAGRPTNRDRALVAAWENAISVLDTLLENARDDYDASKPMSRGRIKEIELALDTIRKQRSALFSQGILYERGDG